jgi:hypothetical protein
MRPKTNIERKFKIEGDRVFIEAEVGEELDKETFLNTHQRRLQQIDNMQNQLSGIKAQIIKAQQDIPQFDETYLKELDILKNKINDIRNLDKLDTLRKSAQDIEVELATVKKDAEFGSRVVLEMSKGGENDKPENV